ncbi:hypothetical protein WOLCODRAFT_74115, partial [Wolfiporia cocos MD-104 SS10]
DISLSELRKALDVQGIEIVENQKESMVGCKALADRTKGRSKFSTRSVSVLMFTKSSRRSWTKRSSLPSRVC